MGPPVASIHSIPGSERNQVRWRFAKATLRFASSSIAAVACQFAVEDRPRLAVADRRERTAAPDRTAHGAPCASSMRPASNWARARSAIQCSWIARLHREPEPRDGRRRSRAAPARPRHPAARRSRARGRRGAGCAGRSVRRASGRAGAAARRAVEAVRSSTPSRAGRGPRVAREGVGVEPSSDGPQVQPGSAGEDGDAVPLRDPGEGRPRVTDEVGHRERLVRVDEVEAVVRDAGAFGGRHLRRADVQAAEDLPRIGRDDLGRPPLPGDPLGEPDREPGLAGRRRASDDDAAAARRSSRR